MTGVLRPKFLSLDSSHLANLIRDLYSSDSAVRLRATSLADLIRERYVLVLSLHHFQELLIHGNQTVVANRISFLQSLPVSAILTSGEHGIAGTAFDIQAAEVAAAFHSTTAPSEEIRRIVATRCFELMPGRLAVRPFLMDVNRLREEFELQAARRREIVAITNSDFAAVSHLKLRDFLGCRLHAPLSIQRNLASLSSSLAEDISEHGDCIVDPDNISARFMEDVAQSALQLRGAIDPAIEILALWDIDPSEVSPDHTIAEIGALGTFRTRLKIFNRALSLPWDDLKCRAREDRLPTGIVNSALTKFRPTTRIWKGSDLTDTHLACLSPYCDITFMDKRTYEGLMVARKKSRELHALIGRIEKAKDTKVLLEKLSL